MSVSRPMPAEPRASQASPAASSPATAPIIAPRTRVDAAAVNQRARTLMDSHSSKWFSPSRRNHQPASDTGEHRNHERHEAEVQRPGRQRGENGDGRQRPHGGAQRPGLRTCAQGKSRAGEPGQGEYRQVGQEAELRDGEYGASHGSGVEPFIDRHHEVPVDEKVDGQQRRRDGQAAITATKPALTAEPR